MLRIRSYCDGVELMNKEFRNQYQQETINMKIQRLEKEIEILSKQNDLAMMVVHMTCEWISADVEHRPLIAYAQKKRSEIKSLCK